jgi:diguanylate cyclase (GGDEF)-like protein
VYCADEGAIGLLSKLLSLYSLGPIIREWWRTPVDYRRQVDDLERRGLLGAAQLIVGACAMLIAAIPIASEFSPSGPDTVVAHTVSAAFAGCAVVWALVWWFGDFPSRTWSIAFIISADIGIPVVSALDSNPLVGLFGINLLLLVSVYIKFFDGPKVLVVHTLWSIAWVLAFSAQIAFADPRDPFLAMAKMLASIAVIVGTPVVAHFGLWVLRDEADSAMTDPLTGLNNRRGFYIQAAQHSEERVQSAIAIDIDHFKKINDRYGHDAGDEVLVSLAGLLRKRCRTLDVISRFGGEEFILLLPGTALNDAAAMAERIREAVSKTSFPFISAMTVSLGVATLSETEEKDALLRRADEALYAAKGDGRNRVMISHEGEISRYPAG